MNRHSESTTPLSQREADAVAACGVILDRLKSVLEDETAALAQRGVAHHSHHAERKNQLLRDLLVAQRACMAAPARRALSTRVNDLRGLLERNQRLLKVHIDAVKVVSAIIVDSIRQGDSDGTYSRYERA